MVWWLVQILNTVLQLACETFHHATSENVVSLRRMRQGEIRRSWQDVASFDLLKTSNSHNTWTHLSSHMLLFDFLLWEEGSVSAGQFNCGTSPGRADWAPLCRPRYKPLRRRTQRWRRLRKWVRGKKCLVRSSTPDQSLQVLVLAGCCIKEWLLSVFEYEVLNDRSHVACFFFFKSHNHFANQC